MTLIIGDEKERAKRNQYWQMLRRANADYRKQGFADERIGDDAYVYYLKQKYGIEIELIDGKITSNYIIRDEKKYTIFLLKYGS
jgi:hypothetical protein